MRLVQFLVRTLSSWLAEGHLRAVTSQLREGQSSGLTSFSYKDIIPIVEATPSRPHLTRLLPEAPPPASIPRDDRAST